MDNVKEEIIDCISQMISTNNSGMPRVICLQGSAGCGKTNIIRNGVSKVLNRPFHQINMGGISDADYLIGHESTYVSSKPGMIVQSLINSKVMNPIIFMDEIDKISKTEKGDDIQSVLIHLTDPIQNSDFQDKYFSGLSIDISKVLFIFSCNDDSKISPILKDRLNIIRVKEPTVADKAVIGKKYILKELIPNIGLNEVDIDEEDVKYIINKYCKEDVGLRSLKKCIETILMKINTASYTPSKYKSLKNISFPLKITQKIIDEVIVKKEDKNSEFMNSMFL
jgi:ATP-dependent Lon protease